MRPRPPPARRGRPATQALGLRPLLDLRRLPGRTQPRWVIARARRRPQRSDAPAPRGDPRPPRGDVFVRAPQDPPTRGAHSHLRLSRGDRSGAAARIGGRALPAARRPQTGSVMGMPDQPSRYDSCLEICGRLEHPGLATDMPIWIDHTQENTTVDQAGIEDALDVMDLRERCILHVGVGNSRFAQRFAGRVRLVDGLTVSHREKELADSLRIPNYTVYFLSKYSREFLTTI